VLTLRSPACRGFSLIEMSMVLLILSLLLTGITVSLTATLQSAHRRAATATLLEIEQALYGFAVAHGRLPCPASPLSAGQASPDGPATRSCNLYSGFVPARTLAIKGRVNCDGLLIDPWGRPYRYSITQTDASANGRIDFVSTDELRNEAEGMQNAKPDLRICHNLRRGCPSSRAVDITTDTAVAVIFSMGRPRKDSPAELENAGENGSVIASGCTQSPYPVGSDNNFYSAPQIERSDQPFDDLLIWISPNILYNKMLDAGRLP